MRCAQMHWSILVLFIPKISEVLVNQRLASDYPGKNNPAELFSAKSENTGSGHNQSLFFPVMKVDNVIKNIL